MEEIGLLIFAGIVILVLPIIISISTNRKVTYLNEEIFLLRKSFDAIYQSLNKPGVTIDEEPVNTKQEIDILDKPEVIPEVFNSNLTTSIIEEELPEEILMEEEVIFNEPVLENNPINEVNVESIHESTPKPKSDIERFIGEKLLSLVGIGVFVLGIFFLVKWAIDQKLINDVGKVSIGILSGILLISTAHRIRNSVRAFSSILVGGGLAVFYFTVYIAFQDYHLLAQTPAFIIMVIVTLFAVMLSIVYDKKELAIIAIIGGFCTPFFVSTGEGNYKVLFSYLLILNIGMFVLASFKRWNLVNIISYAFTILIFGGWIVSKFDSAQGHAQGALVFATLFYITFFASNLVYNIRNQQTFKPVEISLLLSNTFLYYSVGMYCLSFIHKGEFQGIFTICIAAINFGVTFFLYKKEQVDKNLIYLLIGLVLTFVSLAGPIQLEGNYITLFWAIEMVLLLWLGQKSGIRIIKETSILVMALSVISLIMDWVNIYNSNTTISIIFNQAFVTGFVVCTAFILNGFLLKKEETNFWVLNIKSYKRLVKIATLILIYLVPLLELIEQFDSHFISTYINKGGINEKYISSDCVTQNFVVMYNYIFVLSGLFFALKRKGTNVSKVFGLIGSMLVLIFIIFNSNTTKLRHDFLELGLYKNIFYSHFINPILALLLLYLIGKYVLTQVKLRSEWSGYYAWFATITTVIILSCEIIHIWVLSQYQSGFTERSIAIKGIKICLPILWGIMSFAIMARGMHRKLKTLRIISLSLFTLTLLKLFIYDIADATQGGKIAAFISLGILLLIVSFMYQKLKGMLIDEPTETVTETIDTHE